MDDTRKLRMGSGLEVRDLDVEVKIIGTKSGGCLASVSVTLPYGGFTINQIHIKDAANGKPRITFPLSERMHPYITLRGQLKQTVYDAIAESYTARQARTGSALSEVRL